MMRSPLPQLWEDGGLLNTLEPPLPHSLDSSLTVSTQRDGATEPCCPPAPLRQEPHTRDLFLRHLDSGGKYL